MQCRKVPSRRWELIAQRVSNLDGEDSAESRIVQPVECSTMTSWFPWPSLATSFRAVPPAFRLRHGWETISHPRKSGVCGGCALLQSHDDFPALSGRALTPQGISAVPTVSFGNTHNVFPEVPTADIHSVFLGSPWRVFGSLRSVLRPRNAFQEFS